MKQYWEWVATDKFGQSRSYQCEGFDVSEATMLAFLQSGFPGMTFTDIKRIRQGECKPRTGQIQSHTFQFGVMEAALRELGGRIPGNMFSNKVGNRQPIQRVSILDRKRSILDR